MPKISWNIHIRRFPQVIWLRTQRKDGANILAYDLPKQTVTTIMMHYCNTEVKVRSPDGDIEFFDIEAGVLLWDTLTLYLFILIPNYVLRMMIDLIKENGFTQKRQEADDTPQKSLRMQTTQVTQRFLRIDQHKPNPCCKAWRRYRIALASSWMRRKCCRCVLIKKKESSPL